MTKTFRVASVSENTNSFGLTSMILMAKNGEAWTVGANHLNVKKKGTDISVNCCESGHPNWASKGYEIPIRMPIDAPKGVIDEIFA